MTHRATLLGRGYDDRFDSPRLRFRRALLLGLMSVVLPGSAQVAKGHKLLGWLASLAWFVVLGAAGYVYWTHRDDRAQILQLAVDSNLLLWLRIVLLGGAVLWFVLFVDAIRLARPRLLPRVRRALVLTVATATAVSVLGGTVYASQLVKTQRDVVTKVFTAKKVVNPLKGRYNILLMGSDSGRGRTGIRPDSLTVVSIDANTGRTVLVSIPRNLEDVPFPTDSPMHQVYPYGFNCGSECLINAVHTAAADRKDLYPHAKDPGIEATLDAVEGATGLRLNYWVMINLGGFRKLVDAVGGVTLDVKTPIATFGHDDAYRQTYIQPGRRKLDGYQVLWYARSRVQSDDYTRMGRQKCVMSAMLSQLSPQKVLLNAQDLATSSAQLISTSIPAKEFGAFADLALKARRQNISTVSLVPPVVNTESPDFAAIHQLVAQAIRRSERLDAKKPASSPTRKPSSTPTQKPSTSVSDGVDETPAKANQSNDLTATC